jgi:hypothetical protein
MKKLVCFLAIVMLMTIPISAGAALIGTGELKIYASPPTEGGYYLDYDADMQLFGNTTLGLEVFCVSEQNAAVNQWAGYSFYTIPDNNLKVAGWIADNWRTFAPPNPTVADLDNLKGEAQKAIWEVTGVMRILGTSGTDLEIYDKAMAIYKSNGLSNYDFSGWMFASNPIDGQSGLGLQDYLVPKPVPEPATMLLLGAGLIGLAGLGRKKLKTA